jgi:hypothetical protein
LIANFDVSVKDMQKMTSPIQHVMLYYVTPILARIAGTIIYVQRRGKEKKRKEKIDSN